MNIWNGLSATGALNYLLACVACALQISAAIALARSWQLFPAMLIYLTTSTTVYALWITGQWTAWAWTSAFFTIMKLVVAAEASTKLVFYDSVEREYLEAKAYLRFMVLSAACLAWAWLPNYGGFPNSVRAVRFIGNNAAAASCLAAVFYLRRRGLGNPLMIHCLLFGLFCGTTALADLGSPRNWWLVNAMASTVYCCCGAAWLMLFAALPGSSKTFDAPLDVAHHVSKAG